MIIKKNNLSDIECQTLVIYVVCIKQRRDRERVNKCLEKVLTSIDIET